MEIDYTSNINQKHIDEANYKGHTLLYKSTVTDYGYYQVDKCGHRLFRSYSSIRRLDKALNYCPVCVEEKLKLEAQSAGLILHPRIIFHKGNNRLYTLPCGHTKILNIQTVSKLKSGDDRLLTCDICFESKMIDECRKLGIHKLEQGRKFLCILQCGHTQTMTIETIRTGIFRCAECKEERYKDDALKFGAKMDTLPSRSTPDYREYILKCGCVKKLNINNVKRGLFECKDHKESRNPYRKTYVYLSEILFDDGLKILKIGYSLNPDKRHKLLLLVNGSFNINTTVLLNDNEQAVEYERYLHSKFKNFNIDKYQLIDRMSNGYTECYDYLCKDAILNELEGKING